MNNHSVSSVSPCLRGDNTRKCRRGMLSVELIIALPLLLLVLAGSVQMALLLVTQQALGAAAAVGAREASLPGSTQTQVQNAVNRSLAGWRFASQINDVLIQVGDEQPGAVPLSLARTGECIGVTVSVPAAAAAPDLLKYVGLSLADQLSATSILRKE
ncbi:MAG: TadE/TadG family type IV pilus assembly protein [Pirellulales bacterium]